MSCKCSLCPKCMEKAMSAIHMLGSIEERLIGKNKSIQDLEKKVSLLEETVQLQHISMVTAEARGAQKAQEEYANYKILKEAEIEGIGSELLALQLESVRNRKYLNRLEKVLMQQGALTFPDSFDLEEAIDAWHDRNEACMQALEQK